MTRSRILTIFSNFVLLCAGLVVANQSIVGSFEMLRRKKININTMISISAIICFFQSLLMLIFYFADKNTVSVFSGAGLVLLLTGEINNYIVHSRTVDAMEMCTGDNKDKLYSIEGISDDKDAVELLLVDRETVPTLVDLGLVSRVLVCNKSSHAMQRSFLWLVGIHLQNRTNVADGMNQAINWHWLP